MARTYSAGVVTAYGAAKEAGYTGTYEEFCEQQAGFAENAAQVATDKAAVENLKNTFETVTVPASVQTVQAEGATQVAAVTAEGATQIAAVGTAGDAQTGRVQLAADAAVQDIGTAGTTQVNAVNTAGSTQTGAVAAEGATQVAAVTEKGQEVIGSIPQDYTDLTTEVDDLKGTFYHVINTEPDSIADNSYAVGDIFYYPANGILFKVTAPIQVGDTLASGVNITPVTGNAVHYLAESDLSIERKIKKFDNVQLLAYKDPLIYEKSKATNGTKNSYTHNSVTFTTATSGDFNGIMYGYNTSTLTPYSGNGMADTVVVSFYVEISVSGWQLSVYKSGQGTHRYNITNGFNAIEIPASYITNMYFYLPQASTTTGITISDFIISQGSDYENPYAYVTEPPKAFKKMLNIGDSLSNISGNGGTGSNRWQYVLIKKCGIQNFTTSGGVGYTVALYNGQTSIYETVQALTVDNDVDIVTFWGGTNDWSMGVPIGDFDANVLAQDNTTFYGAVISCIKKLITLFPAKRIFMIGTTPRMKSDVEGDFSTRGAKNANNNTLMDFNDAVKRVAEYYSIPYIDLMHTAGITDLNYTEFLYRQTYGTGFNYYLHFTELGETRIGDTLAGFINSVTGCTWK